MVKEGVAQPLERSLFTSVARVRILAWSHKCVDFVVVSHVAPRLGFSLRTAVSLPQHQRTLNSNSILRQERYIASSSEFFRVSSVKNYTFTGNNFL